eukprot:gene5199-7533_t
MPCGKGAGAAITTHWSQTKNSEKFEHASCGLAGIGHKNNVACTHLFVGWSAWLYTPAEDFCCISGCSSGRGVLWRAVRIAVTGDADGAGDAAG